MIASCNDAGPHLIAHSQQASHGRLSVCSVLLLQGVYHILHQHKGWLEELHNIVECCDLPVPAGMVFQLFAETGQGSGLGRMQFAAGSLEHRQKNNCIMHKPGKATSKGGCKACFTRAPWTHRNYSAGAISKLGSLTETLGVKSYSCSPMGFPFPPLPQIVPSRYFLQRLHQMPRSMSVRAAALRRHQCTSKSKPGANICGLSSHISSALTHVAMQVASSHAVQHLPSWRIFSEAPWRLRPLTPWQGGPPITTSMSPVSIDTPWKQILLVCLCGRHPCAAKLCQAMLCLAARLVSGKTVLGICKHHRG